MTKIRLKVYKNYLISNVDISARVVLGYNIMKGTEYFVTL
jgi:hypothetical protein